MCSSRCIIIGTIKIEFINWKKRPKAKFLINELLSECNKIAGIKVEIIEKKDGPPKDKDVELEISNYNKGELEKDSKFILISG